MKHKLIVIIGAAFLFTNCVNSESKTQENQIEEQEINIKTATQKFEKNNFYASVKLEYPQISIDGEIENPLNDSINLWVNKVRAEYSGDLLEEKKSAVNTYIKDYKINKNENTQKYTTSLESEIAETPNYFSVLVTFYNYDLGAHGNTYRKALVMKKSNQQLVSLADVIDLSTPQKLADFNKLLGAKVSTDDYCEKPMIKSNYKRFIVKNGELGIAFNDYDFGAYTCGSKTIFISNEDLKSANLIKTTLPNV